MADQVRINGNIHSWGSIICKIDGDRFYGFDKIAYGDKLEVVKAYGMGKHHAPRGRSKGKYTTEPVTLGGPKSTVQALRAALAAKSSTGKSYGTVEFEIIVQFVETDDTPITVRIERCRLVENAESHEESADPLKDEIKIDCMKIRRNGLVLFDDSDATP